MRVTCGGTAIHGHAEEMGKIMMNIFEISCVYDTAKKNVLGFRDGRPT
jgi:hypothetical protein